MDKKVSRPKPKRLRYWLIPFVGIITLVYVYFAFAPTGYEDFKVRRMDAVERARNLVGPELFPDISQIPQSPTPPVKKDKEQSSTQKTSLIDLGVELAGISSDLEKAGGIGWFTSSFGYWNELRLYIPVNDVDLTDGTSRFDQAPKLKQRILSEVANSAAWSSYSRQESSNKAEQISPQTVHKAIDRFSDALLDYTSAGHELNRDLLNLHAYNICRLGRIACARSAIRGDVDRAGRIIKRTMEIVVPYHFSKFPEGSMNWWNDQWPILLVEMLPDETLAGIATTTEKARLTPKQMSDLAVARIIRTTNYSVQALQSDGAYRPTGEEWYAFPKWAYKKIAIPALRPIAARQTEKLTMAWITDDPQAIEHEQSLARTLMLMDARDGLVLPSQCSRKEIAEGSQLWKAYRKPYMAREWGDDFNIGADFSLLMIAAERYRRQYGAYPTGADELVPRYLDESFLSDPARIDDGSPTWTVYVLESSDQLIGIYREKFDKLVDRYKADHGTSPTEASDLRPYVQSDEELESFRPRTVRIENMPVLCRIRMDTFHNELLHDFDFGSIVNSPNTQPALLRAESDKPQAIEVLLRYPVSSPKTQKYLDLLAATPPTD